jgi:pilus assembly protein CpaB
MARRIGLLAIAVIVALFGAAAVLTYASHSNARAARGQVVVSVLVAKQDVSAGTSAGGMGSAVELRSLPTAAVPAGALTNLTPLGDQVTAEDVHAGQVLLPSQFVGKQIAGSIKIPAGMMAISVQVQDPQRVGGFVLPGSHVAVFDTYTKGSTTAEATTRLLLNKVQVIAVGPTALSTVGGTAAVQSNKSGGIGSAGSASDPTAILTVAVDAVQALKLVHAAQTGRLYFALLSETSKTGDGTRAVDNSSLFG